MLSQALTQVSMAGARVYSGWTPRFAEMVTTLVEVGELQPTTDVVDVAEAIWTCVLGCHLVSAAVGDDPFTRLSRAWRVVLRSIVPADTADDVANVVDRVARRYAVGV